MSFRLVKGEEDTPNWIAAQGVIEPDTPEKFEIFLFKICNEQDICDLHSENLTTIGFHSTGGHLLASMKLGRMIREKGLNTALAHLLIKDPTTELFSISEPAEWEGGNCESACVYAFLGGVSRNLSLFNADDLFEGIDATSFKNQRGFLGVHQFYNDKAILQHQPELSTEEIKTKYKNDTAISQHYMSQLISYFNEMGISTSMLALASEQQSTDIRYLNEAELTVLNAINIDVKKWSVQDKYTFYLMGLKSPYQIKNLVDASTVCYSNLDNTKSIEMIINFYPQHVFPKNNANNLSSAKETSKNYPPNEGQFDGITLSYAEYNVVPDNFYYRVATSNFDQSYIRFEAPLAQWEHMVNYGKGKINVKSSGHIVDGKPYDIEINLYLDEEFKKHFRRLNGGYLECNSRELGGLSAARAIGSNYPQRLEAKILDPDKVNKTEIVELGLHRLYFAPTSTNLTTTSQSRLKELAVYLKNRPNNKIIVVGRTASFEEKKLSKEGALELGIRRAVVVADFLKSKNVQKNQMTITSLGLEDIESSRQITNDNKEPNASSSRSVVILLR